jgi:hypothetical protein
MSPFPVSFPSLRTCRNSTSEALPPERWRRPLCYPQLLNVIRPRCRHPVSVLDEVDRQIDRRHRDAKIADVAVEQAR